MKDHIKNVTFHMVETTQALCDLIKAITKEAFSYEKKWEEIREHYSNIIDDLRGIVQDLEIDFHIKNKIFKRDDD